MASDGTPMTITSTASAERNSTKWMPRVPKQIGAFLAALHLLEVLQIIGATNMLF